MSTMLPDEMSGGSRMDGNSIWRCRLAVSRHSCRASFGKHRKTYQALVRREENRDAGVDLADG
jgi:hypothetical protein